MWLKNALPISKNPSFVICYALLLSWNALFVATKIIKGRLLGLYFSQTKILFLRMKKNFS